MTEIYLDNAATTKPWPEVIEAMREAMDSGFGNASSLHRRGLAAARIVKQAREDIEAVVGSGPWRTIFTSGGSEADTMAVLGSVPRGKRNHVVTTTVEHAAVTEPCKQAAASGAELTEIGAGETGVIDPERVAEAVTEKTALVTVIHVANEIGTQQPVAEVARLVKAKAPKCRLHVDAVQAVAQLSSLDCVPEVDMVSVSAHKIHGPQGVGALLTRPNVRPRPLIFGGDQQDGLRPGTLNLPGIAGFARAMRLLRERREEGVGQMRRLTDRLIGEVTGSMDGVRQLGDPSCRAPGMVVFAVDGVRSEVLLHALEARGVLASSGSACHSTRTKLPRSLRDAGLRTSEGAVRFSLTLDNSSREIEQAIDAIKEAINAVRGGRAGGQ